MELPERQWNTELQRWEYPPYEGSNAKDALLALISEYGQCRWSEGSYAAVVSSVAAAKERRDREQAFDLFKQIEAAIDAMSEDQ